MSTKNSFKFTEVDENDYDANMINFIEKKAGSALDTAQEYIDDF